MATKKESYSDMTVQELNAALNKLQKEYQEYRFEKVVGDARKTHEIKLARKNIARVKTFLHKHELLEKK